MNSAQNTMQCSYSNLYEPIYDSAYGSNFVFYEEEELIDDESGFTQIPSISNHFCQMATSKQNTSSHHH